jgi:hypothetical protein
LLHFDRNQNKGFDGFEFSPNINNDDKKDAFARDYKYLQNFGNPLPPEPE